MVLGHYTPRSLGAFTGIPMGGFEWVPSHFRRIRLVVGEVRKAEAVGEPPGTELPGPSNSGRPLVPASNQPRF